MTKKSATLVSQMSPQRVYYVVYPTENIEHYYFTLFEIHGKQHKAPTVACIHYTIF